MSKYMGVYNPAPGTVLMHETFTVDETLATRYPDTVVIPGHVWKDTTGGADVFTKASGAATAAGVSIATTFAMASYSCINKPLTVTQTAVLGTSRMMPALRYNGLAISSASCEGFVLWMTATDATTIKFQPRKLLGSSSTGAVTLDSTDTVVNVTVADSSAAQTYSFVDTGTGFQMYLDDTLVGSWSDTSYVGNEYVGLGAHGVNTSITEYKVTVT